MSFDSYTQHMPTLQRTTFWSNYMAGLKGNNEMLWHVTRDSCDTWRAPGTLSARDPEAVVAHVSPFSQYRAVDVTMYDLIYGQ